LRERREDIEPNLDYEVEQVAKRNGRIVRFSTEARSAFLKFASTPEATWSGNFRDLSAAVSRLATLSSGGRITVDDVEEEVARLRAAWHRPAAEGDILATVPGLNLDSIDLFDRVQLAQVVTTCRESASLSEAGRMLFAASRARRASVNDADRLRKYLARFGLDWDAVRAV
jgi:transcriptional regulatory protein RtcR